MQLNSKLMGQNLHSVYVGVDIGGSNVRIALADSNLNIIGDVFRTKFKKFNTVEEEVEENICLQLENILKVNGLDRNSIKAIGISLAALFDRVSGLIVNWPNNKLWDGFSLKDYLYKRFGTNTIFEDDANSAAVGELCYGAAKGYDSYAYVTISTGIGCGLVLNGNLYTGAHGWAGEIGHTKAKESSVKCKCGGSGCLQTFASGPALLARSKELAKQYGVETVEEICDLKEVVKCALAGEKWALKVFDEAGDYIGNALSNMVIMLDLPLVVIGGGVSLAGDILISPIKKVLESNLKCRDRNVEVNVAACGDNSGVLGIVAIAGGLIKSNRRLLKEFDIKGSDIMGKKNKTCIGIINGPNINMLGVREPHIYGSEKWDSIEEKLCNLANKIGIELLFFQSNHEGEIVDFIQKNIELFCGIVINPAAYTKTGYAILDAIMSVNIPYVEVHISNIFLRGGWHSESIFAENAVGHVIGFKGYVYELGLRAILNHIGMLKTEDF